MSSGARKCEHLGRRVVLREHGSVVSFLYQRLFLKALRVGSACLPGWRSAWFTSVRKHHDLCVSAFLKTVSGPVHGWSGVCMTFVSRLAGSR